MGGPFRFDPPALQPGLLVRTRLLARMARRWDRRLVIVAGGPGFGKTALLVGAMSQQDPASGDTDVWLSCEPTDADADLFLAGLGEALGLQSCRSVDDVAATAWMRAPDHVCLVLDDVHQIPPDSDGARALGHLLSVLPRNGHVVAAARGRVPFPVARLAAQRQLERIVESDLLFDASWV